MTKKIAFSILHRNNLEDTIACLNSLLKSDYQSFHIYLLDNGSQDTQEFIELQKLYSNNERISLHQSDMNLGFTGGNNYNLELIGQEEYDYICLLNNDCLVSSDRLGKFMTDIEQYPAGIFGPVIHNPDGTIQSCGSSINLRTGSNPRIHHLDQPSQEVDCVSGSCFVISREVFDTVGLLDDQYFAYREESDYCLRAKTSGYSITSINIVGVTHHEETATNKKRPYYTYLMFRNRILFLRKHANNVQYIVSWIVLIGYVLFMFPRVFGLSNVRYLWKGLRDGIAGRGGSISSRVL